MLLIHGFTGTWRMWTPVLPTLAESHAVLAPTLAGHHGAATPEGDVSIAWLADELERVLDEEGLETAHIAGNSLGGWLSLELARRGRARSVVALSPAGGWREAKDLRRTSALIRRSVTLGKRSRPLLHGPLLAPPLRKQMLLPIMEHGDRVPASGLLDMIDDASGCQIVEDFALATTRDGPFAGDMSKVTCPVRIAWGQNDRTIPPDANARPLLDRVPDAEFVVLPGVGHVPMFDDPALVAATILEVTLAVDAATASGARTGSNGSNGRANGRGRVASGRGSAAAGSAKRASR